MIVTCVKHGRQRRDGRALIKHLTRAENEIAEIVELGNTLADSLAEIIEQMEIYRDASQSTKAAFHHVTVSPSKDHSRAKLIWSVHEFRRELDPMGTRPYAIVIHQKMRAEEGGSKQHAHLILSHVDRYGKALDDSYTKIRTERVARETEYDLGENALLGRHHKAVLKVLRKTRPEVANWLESKFGENPPKPQSALSERARGRARQQNFNIAEAKASVRIAWGDFLDIPLFQENLKKAGLVLRRGEKAKVWIITDDKDHFVGAAHRLLRIRLNDFNESMQAQLDFENERDLYADDNPTWEKVLLPDKATDRGHRAATTIASTGSAADGGQALLRKATAAIPMAKTEQTSDDPTQDQNLAVRTDLWGIGQVRPPSIRR